MEHERLQSLFKEYGLEWPCVLIKEKIELSEAMKKAGEDPWTLKAISPDIIHKTDIGAVRLNLKSLAEMEAAWDEILENVKENKPEAVIEGMLMQNMATGKEVIIGMKRGSIFGPTVLFGLGGIFTEALKDTSLRVTPIEIQTAREMISEIRGIKILTGLRGEKSVDLEKLAEIIVKISKLAMDHPEILEIDLNPVMASPDRATIVDARAAIRD
jgi:acyl-CoA synthetase (NDP forming)